MHEKQRNDDVSHLLKETFTLLINLIAIWLGKYGIQFLFKNKINHLLLFFKFIQFFKAKYLTVFFKKLYPNWQNVVIYKSYSRLIQKLEHKNSHCKNHDIVAFNKVYFYYNHHVHLIIHLKIITDKYIYLIHVFVHSYKI